MFLKKTLNHEVIYITKTIEVYTRKEGSRALKYLENPELRPLDELEL